MKESIQEQAEQKGLADLFEEILVPMEEVVEVRRGKKVSAERKFFPGYVLVRMVLNDETWSLVRNTRQGDRLPRARAASRRRSPITRPSGSGNQMQEGVEHPKPTIAFISGDKVRVSDGPFASFSGVVEEVDEAQGPAQGVGIDLRPGDAGRAGVLAGREALASSCSIVAGAPVAARMDR